MELIRVTQLPIIEERLKALKADVDGQVSEALSLVCTEETIQAVKGKRTELRKQFDALEEQRKAVKAAVLGPYNQFEAVYKECVSDAFKSADMALKGKIDDVEADIKKRCEDGLREYFDELCAANHLDWLRYEQSGIQVDMASAKQKTPKKLREALAQFVAKVNSDVEQISTMEDAEEILMEYKRTLDAMGAIGTVSDRHRRIEAEKAERERREAQRAAEAEATRKVEAVAPPVVVEPPKEEERVFKCSFTVWATKERLKKLKDFLIMEGIKYE